MAFYEIGKTIRLNRECDGHTLESLSDGICSVQTLYRIEKGKSRLKAEYYEAFLEKLQDCQERNRTVFIGDSPQIMEIKKHVETIASYFDYQNAEESLGELEKYLDIKQPVVLQYILHKKLVFDLYASKITAELYIQKMESALELTVPKYRRYINMIYPFRHQELMMIMSIANAMHGNGHYEEAHKLFQSLIRILNHSYICGNHAGDLKIVVLRNYALLYHTEHEYQKERILSEAALRLAIMYNYGRHLATILEEISCTYYDDDVKNMLPQNHTSDKKTGMRYLRQAYYVALARGQGQYADLFRKSFQRKYGKDACKTIK